MQFWVSRFHDHQSIHVFTIHNQQFRSIIHVFTMIKKREIRETYETWNLELQQSSLLVFSSVGCVMLRGLFPESRLLLPRSKIHNASKVFHLAFDLFNNFIPKRIPKFILFYYKVRFYLIRNFKLLSSKTFDCSNVLIRYSVDKLSFAKNSFKMFSEVAIHDEVPLFKLACWRH